MGISVLNQNERLKPSQGKESKDSPANTEAEDRFEYLVKKSTEGDRESLSVLCSEIARGVLFQMTYILGDRTNAEDVAQEVLIRVCENIRGLRNPKAFKGWLARIMVNEKNRYLAKHLKHGTMMNIDDYQESISDEHDGQAQHILAVENEEVSKVIMNVISDLPMRQREAVMLYYYSGLSVTEVAAAMKTTTQSVSKNLKIAREKLKIKLKDQKLMAGYIEDISS